MPSKRFLDEIRKSHTVISYVKCRTANQEEITLTAVDGSVRVDRNGKIRRSCTIECVDPDGTLTPEGPESDLTPFVGTELRPYRGVRYSDGTVEVVPLGVFRLERSRVTDSSDGGVKITLEGYDRSAKIQADKFYEPWLIESGTNLVVAIKAIVERTFPDTEYDCKSTSVVTTAPKIYDVDDEPWDVITELALSAGCEAYFAADGRFVVAPSIDLNHVPTEAYTYVEGEGCTLLEVSREFIGGTNGVIVDGESIGDDEPPVRATVWDDDPTSPTYYLGPYGRNPLYHRDQNVKSEADAEAVGFELLYKELGFAAGLSVTAMVNPALEGGKIIRVQRERSRIFGLYSVESFSVPLKAAGTQDVELRKRKSIRQARSTISLQRRV